MEAMTRREWRREKRRLWWRKNEDKVIGAAMAPIALAMMGFVVFVLAMLCVGTIAAIIKLWGGKKDE